MPRIEKAFANVFLFTIACIIAFVILEITVTIFVTKYATPEQFLRWASFEQLREKANGEQMLVTPHRYLGYIPTPDYKKGKNRHNQLGYRGEEIDVRKSKNEFRIVCIGGSTTYTSEVQDYRLSYPYQLQQELRSNGYKDVEVVNAGLFDWTTWEVLGNFQYRVLDLQPDLVIIYLGLNDIESRMVWPPKAYRGDNSGARVSNLNMYPHGILEHSALARVILVELGFIKPHSSLDRLLIARPSTSYIDDWDQQTTSRTYPRGIFEEVSPETMLAENIPKYFRRNLENLIAIAEFHGIKTIVATFAYKPVSKESNNRGGSPLFWEAIDEHNDVLREIAAGSPAHLFDFEKKFPKNMGYFGMDGIHLNEEGARKKAKLFARFIQEHELVQ